MRKTIHIGHRSVVAPGIENSISVRFLCGREFVPSEPAKDDPRPLCKTCKRAQDLILARERPVWFTYKIGTPKAWPSQIGPVAA